jgi:CBS domain containing-hemolysin-like protein
MDVLSNLVLRLLGMASMAHPEGALSEEEIRLLIESDESRVQLTDQKRALLTRVLRSAERAVRVAMRPRVDIAVLSCDDPLDAVLAQARDHEYSRFPVVRGHDPDRVVGYVHARELLMASGEPPKLEQIMREPLYVPETATVAAVLERMRLGQVHLAIVVDEYGGTSGLVTLEDLVEEIVGEIQDEFDVEAVGLTKLVDGSLRASGATTVYDACAALEVESADDPAWTLARCAVERLGRIPRVGDQIEAGEIRIEVVTMRRRRVTETRVRRVLSAEGA